MSTTIAEHLSAVLDGEAGKFEQRRVLDEVTKNDELQASLSSYALIGETMRNDNQANIAGSSFLKGIHDEIDSEPEYSQVQITEKKVSNGHSAWKRPVVGFAMAASVAAVAVIGIQNYKLLSGSDVSIASNQQQIKPAPTTTQFATSPYGHPDEKTRNLYKHYLDSHVQFASTTPIMPAVRMVSYSSSY